MLVSVGQVAVRRVEAFEFCTAASILLSGSLSTEYRALFTGCMDVILNGTRYQVVGKSSLLVLVCL